MNVQQSQYGSSSQLPPDQGPAIPQAATDDAFGTQASQAVPGMRLQQQQDAQPSTSQAGSVQPCEGLRGFIAAGSMGLGDVLSFAFSIASAEVQLVSGAQCSNSAPEGSHAQRQRMPSSHRMYVEVLPGPSRQQSRDQHAPGEGTAARVVGEAVRQQDTGSFSWVPRGLAAARSLGLPRRVCWPLQQPARCAEVCT